MSTSSPCCPTSGRPQASLDRRSLRPSAPRSVARCRSSRRGRYRRLGSLLVSRAERWSLWRGRKPASPQALMSRFALMTDGDWRDSGFLQRRPSVETLVWVAASMGRGRSRRWLSPIDRWRLLCRESADCRAAWGAKVRRTAAVAGRVWRGGELGEGDRQPWCGGGERASGSEHPGY
jgi:hypothetical protein